MSAPSATAGAALPTPSHPSASLAIVVLALLLSIQPVTTDLYLPALPALTRDLGATVAAGQLTLSALLLAFGCSQLVWGRCQTALAAALCCWRAWAFTRRHRWAAPWHPAWPLVVWRVLQGAGHGRQVVMCARHRARPVHPLAGARAMSRRLPGWASWPACAPPWVACWHSGWAGAPPCWR